MTETIKRNLFAELTDEFIVEQHSLGLSQTEISKLVGCSRPLISKKAKILGLKFVQQKKYPTNEEFLMSWSKESSYILGFIMADGCVNIDKKRFRLKIELQASDIEILEKIKSYISPDRPIRVYSRDDARRGNTYHVASLEMNISRELFDYLGSLGITPQKCANKCIPDQVPQEFVWQFIRGLCDGDGSIRERNGKNEGGFDWSLSATSKTLIDQLHKHIPHAIVSCTSAGRNKTLHKIAVRNKPGIRIIRDQLYDDTDLYLTRKFDIMQQV